MSLIEVKGLCKSFGKVEVLKNISFTVEKGQTVAVIGPSGSGKSTMLRCLIDLEKADGGDIVIDGGVLVKDGRYADDTEAKKVCMKMGMVFQSFNLFPHMSVMKNLTTAPVLVNKEDKKQAEEKAMKLLEKVGLADKSDAMPGQLSGGQAQRVAIARALMMEPEILLFDEPTSSLDPQLTAEVLSVMKELANEKMTMVVVTHEMGFAREAADKVLFMDETGLVGQGTVEDIFDNPKDERIKTFINSILK